MTQKDIFINPYKIIWVEFFPTKAEYVPRGDRKLLGDTLLLGSKTKTYRKWFVSKNVALIFLENIRGKLSQQYKCLLSTDKQFGMAKEKDGYAIPYTKKQLAEAYYV